MTEGVKFGFSESKAFHDDLEELRKNREVDRLIERALQGDSNLFVLDEVMNCVAKGPVHPKRFKHLFSALEPVLNRGSAESRPTNQTSRQDGLTTMFTGPDAQPSALREDNSSLELGFALGPSRSLSRFTFVEDVLPGNSKADSLCVSPDGRMVAYLTSSAAPLQKVHGKYIRVSLPENCEKRSCNAARSLDALPRIVNVVSFDPYRSWVISLDESLLDLETSSLELVGLDEGHLYLLQSFSTQKQIIDIGVQNGKLLGSHNLTANCGASFLDVRLQRIFFIDRATQTLDCLRLSDGSRQSAVLGLPPELTVGDLSSLALYPDGSTGAVLVSRHSFSGILMGLFRWPPQFTEQGTDLEVRWIKQKESLLDSPLEVARCSPPLTIQDGTAISSTLYCMDGSGTIYSLDISSVADWPLDGLDPRKLLRAFPSSKEAKRASFPLLATGTERPILVTYDVKSERVCVWDTTSKQPLVSLPCPFRIDSLELAAHDTLLIAKSRSSRTSRDRVAITFLDFFLIVGQSPSSLRNDCLPILEPLEAWAPDNQLLAVIRRLVAFNSQRSQEAHI